MNLKQIRSDLDKGILICRATIAELLAHAESLESEKHEVREQCAQLADQWGNARQDENGGSALRNYAIALRQGVTTSNPRPGDLVAARREEDVCHKPVCDDRCSYPRCMGPAPAVPELPCPVCGGEAMHATEILARTTISGTAQVPQAIEALRRIREAGYNTTEWAVWAQKTAAWGMEPGKWPEQPQQAPESAQSEVPSKGNLVPGKMRCAKCDLSLIRTVLDVASGSSYAGDNRTEPCPNGCGPLWPITWEQEAKDAYKTCDQLFDRAKAAEDAFAAEQRRSEALQREATLHAQKYAALAKQEPQAVAVPEWSTDPDGELELVWCAAGHRLSISVGGAGLLSWAMLSTDGLMKGYGSREFSTNTQPSAVHEPCTTTEDCDAQGCRNPLGRCDEAESPSTLGQHVAKDQADEAEPCEQCGAAVDEVCKDKSDRTCYYGVAKPADDKGGA